MYRAIYGRRRGAVKQLHFLARLNHFVHQAVFFRLLGRHVVIAVGIQPYLLFTFAGMLRDNFDEALFQLKHVIDLTLDVARRSLRPPRDLVDHDIGIRQREPFAFRAGAKQNCSHACSHAEAIRCHIARQELHGIVNR